MTKATFEVGDEVIYLNYLGYIVDTGRVIYVGTGKYINGITYGKDISVVQTEGEDGIHTWTEPKKFLRVTAKSMLRKRLKNG